MSPSLRLLGAGGSPVSHAQGPARSQIHIKKTIILNPWSSASRFAASASSAASSSSKAPSTLGAFPGHVSDNFLEIETILVGLLQVVRVRPHEDQQVLRFLPRWISMGQILFFQLYCGMSRRQAGEPAAFMSKYRGSHCRPWVTAEYKSRSTCRIQAVNHYDGTRYNN